MHNWPICYSKWFPCQCVQFLKESQTFWVHLKGFQQWVALHWSCYIKINIRWRYILLLMISEEDVWGCCGSWSYLGWMLFECRSARSTPHERPRVPGKKHYPDSIIFTSSWPLTGSRWRLFSLDDRVTRDAFKRPRESEKGSTLEKWSIYCYNVDWVKSVKCWKLYRDEIREMSLKRQISLSICAFVHFITALKTA